MSRVLTVIAFLALVQECASFSRRSPLRRPTLANSVTRVGGLSEHLVDCVANPQIAELYGGVNSAVCIDKNIGIFSGLGGLIEQSVTIGFLVMSYFFFKRSSNGVSDWIEADVERDDDLEFSNSYLDDDGNEIDTDGSSSEECPQCNGTGQFSWNKKKLNKNSFSPCELCGGSGTIVFTANNNKIRRQKIRILPERVIDVERDELE